MKIVKSLEESFLLVKAVRETIKNEPKEQIEGFLGMLWGTLGAILLGNYLQIKAQLEQFMAQLEQTRIFNATPFYKK